MSTEHTSDVGFSCCIDGMLPVLFAQLHMQMVREVVRSQNEKPGKGILGFDRLE